jgi:hypothetical protein
MPGLAATVGYARGGRRPSMLGAVCPLIPSLLWDGKLPARSKEIGRSSLLALLPMGLWTPGPAGTVSPETCGLFAAGAGPSWMCQFKVARM